MLAFCLFLKGRETPDPLCRTLEVNVALINIYGDAGYGRRRVQNGLQLWKPIPGWEDMYEISDMGLPARVRLYSSDRKNLKPMFLKCYYPDNAYAWFRVKGYKYCIAGTVLTVFKGKADTCEIPHHIDGNIKNCQLVNLEWKHYEQCSALERQIYM